MVAANPARCNFGAAQATGDTTAIVTDAPPLLALRLAGQDYALESGRDYLLGSAADCDLRLPAGAAAHQARLAIGPEGIELVDLGSQHGTILNGARATQTRLALGDVLQFGEHGGQAIVVHDLGDAAIVPIPSLRFAAIRRRFGIVREAAQALRLAGPRSIQQRVTDELRRTPWLALSMTLHVAVLLALWLFAPKQAIGGDAPATVHIDLAGQPPSPVDGPLTPPAIEPERAESPFEVPDLPDDTKPSEEPPVPVDDTTPPAPAFPRENAPIGGRKPPATSPTRTGTGSGTDVGTIGSGGFRKTVGELRKSGLEIVFVFDSTGSMTRTILDTKATIAQMLVVLRALVPDARIGLVTYRDHGQRERYLVQQVPLGFDFWRASNFVQFVTAEGGGDRAEDVRAGLQAAFQQNWRSGARRVVVLAGDAPPHANDFSRLLSEVRTFAANGRSFVHTLVTSPDSAGRDTHEAFTNIATAGKGTCQGQDDHDRVLQRVLTLAFGREFDQDIATVVRTVNEEAERVDVQALDLARRGGPDLAAALRQTPIAQELWNAIVRRPRRAVITQVLDILSATDTSEATRQAIAAALQKVFELPLPPIDPIDGGVPIARELTRLRALAGRLAD